MVAAIYTSTSLTWEHIESMPRAELVELLRRVRIMEREAMPDGR